MTLREGPATSSPSRRSTRRNPRRSVALFAPLALVVVFAVVIAGALLTNRNFWFDEAMSFQAIANEGFLAPGQPMGLFEQTMPYGVYVIFKVLVDAVGLNETILRIPVILAYVVGLVALYRASRILPGTIPRIAALAAGGLTVWVVYESAMFKHYIFEYAAGALILAAGVTLMTTRFRPRSVIWFFAVSTVSVLFSNTAPFATGAVALVVLVTAFVTDRRSLFPARWMLVAAGIAYAAIFGVLYLTVITPAAVFQLSLPFYESSGLTSLASALAELWAPTGKPLYLLFGGAVFAVILVGAVALFVAERSRARGVPDGLARAASPAPAPEPALAWYPYLVLLVSLLAMVAGVVAGLAPFANPRHVLFSAPIIGLAFGAAVGSIARAIAPVARRVVAVRVLAGALTVAVAAGFVAVALVGSFSRHEEVGRVLAAGDAACDVTYASYSFQPAAELYIARDGLGIDLVGTVSTESGLGSDSWLQRIRDDMPGYQARAVAYFTQNGPACLLASPTPATDDLLKPLAAAGIVCTPVDRLTGVGLYRCAS